MRHVVDYRAPLVLHPILLKRYYPYLDDDASGHFQVGRGYDKNGDRPTRDRVLRAVEPAALRPLRAVHRPGPVARCVPQLPGQPGALPAQHRRLMRARPLAAPGRAAARCSLAARPDRLRRHRPGRADGPRPTPRSPPSSSSPSSSTSSPSERRRPPVRPTATPSPQAPVGSRTRPGAARAGRDLLDWTPRPGSGRRHGDPRRWSQLPVDEAAPGRRADGRTASTTSAPPRGSRSPTPCSTAAGPSSCCRTGRRRARRPRPWSTCAAAGRSSMDGSSAVPTVNGGTWALGEGHLLHATTDRGGATASPRWTWRRGPPSAAGAPRRHGFNAARITPGRGHAAHLRRPRPVACRTAVRLDGTTSRRCPASRDCKALESLALRRRRGLVGDPEGARRSRRPTSTPAPRRRAGSTSVRPPPGRSPGAATRRTSRATRSATATTPRCCGGRPTAASTWSTSPPAAQAFLTAPRCGGDTVTVTALAQSGDEQVSAPLG